MVTINLALDERVKKGMEQVCSEEGITIEEAFVLFAEKVAKEKRFSFDSFYSPENLQYLEGIQKDVREGKAHFAEHELIDD